MINKDQSSCIFGRRDQIKLDEAPFCFELLEDQKLYLNLINRKWKLLF